LIEQALKDPEAGVREQALRLADERLAAAPKLQAAVTVLADDPSPRVRFQLAYTLGEAEGAELVAALAKVARRDVADPWTQVAVLSSAYRTAPVLLEALAHDATFTSDLTAGRRQLFTRLAALVGARAGDAGVAQALQLLMLEAEGGDGWKVALLEGLGQGLQNSRRPLSQLWEQPPPGLKVAVERALPFFTRAAAVASKGERVSAQRLAAVRLLAFAPFATAAPALQELLGPRNPAELQQAALRALAQHPNARVADLLLATWGSSSPGARREIFEALFARVDRLNVLLTALEQNKVPLGQLEPFRVEQLRKHPNAQVRQRAQKLLAGQGVSDRQKVVADYRAALQLRPNGTRGKAVFKKNCATCHRLENEGIEVGPDLLSALRTKTPEGLVTDILDPSREVDPRFINYVVSTKAGRVFTGMIAAETATSITLRRAEKAEDTILRTDLDEIQATAKSLMPENLETQLSQQDLADVIAYLLAVAAGK
jgi:putative heme-binding domain-containing protein